MANIKTMTIDDFYSKEECNRLTNILYGLQWQPKEFGKELDNFNLLPPNSNELFSKALNMKMEVRGDEDQSGVFRIPEMFIHFEEFNSKDDWVYVVALQESTFNIFEHKNGAKSALDDYKHNYRNLFEWDLLVNYILKPGQGILFRPWLFHSFDTGLIQTFKLNEKL